MSKKSAVETPTLNEFGNDPSEEAAWQGAVEDTQPGVELSVEPAEPIIDLGRIVLGKEVTRKLKVEIDEPTQQDDGLWVARAWLLDEDIQVAPQIALLPTVKALASAIGALERKSGSPFSRPYRFDEAGWVANRWCELLPISLAAKQKLMELDDPQMRLRLVDEYLRNKGVVGP
jgi:hypothetical protein